MAWTNEQKELVRDLYINTRIPAKVLADKFGVTLGNFRSRVRRMGLVQVRSPRLLQEEERVIIEFIDCSAKQIQVELKKRGHYRKYRSIWEWRSRILNRQRAILNAVVQLSEVNQ